MPRVAFLSSPSLWQRGHGPDHPLKPERLRRTHELLEAYGAFDAPNVTLVAPRAATRSELTLFHSAEYVDAVRALSDGDLTIPARRYGFGSGDNPVFEGMYESETLKVGSALQGAQMIVNGEQDVAFSYSGGLHHGCPNLASGFCVFNDAAVAIHWLLGQGLRVAYVDIDVHHGDGVQNAFYASHRVLTISLHQDGRTLFPGTGFVEETGIGAGKGYAVNVPLPPYTDDALYLRAFEEIVPPLLVRFGADVVVTQLGVDTHARDPLASLLLTTSGHLRLFSALEKLAPRWLALGGGGYEVDVVPRSWTLASGVMSGQTFADELPASYRAKYGGRQLRDAQVASLDGPTRGLVEGRLARVIDAVKMLHHL